MQICPEEEGLQAISEAKESLNVDAVQPQVSLAHHISIEPLATTSESKMSN